MGHAGGGGRARQQALSPQAESWAAGGGESYQERKPQQTGKMAGVPKGKMTLKYSCVHLTFSPSPSPSHKQAITFLEVQKLTLTFFFLRSYYLREKEQA